MKPYEPFESVSRWGGVAELRRRSISSMKAMARVEAREAMERRDSRWYVFFCAGCAVGFGCLVYVAGHLYWSASTSAAGEHVMFGRTLPEPLGRWLWLGLKPMILATLAGVFWFAFQAFRALKLRNEVGVCRRCGYDLRATPDRCPECGMEAAKRA